MGLLDILLGDHTDESDKKQDWDRSVFDSDRFKNRNSGNWVDWEDVSTGNSTSDGFEHPYVDNDGEW